MRTPTRLVGVYRAEGSLRGEIAYVVGKLLGTAHCALCDITHSPVRRKAAWDRMAAGLGVPFELVHLDERDADPPATALVAFATDDLPAGTVVSDPVFFHMPVRSDEQVAAIRWWHDEAVVDQVYVAEPMRRRHVGTVAIYAASAFHQFHGWPGRLHSDGRRTVLGEALVAGLRHPDRIAELGTLLSPMDPAATPPPTGD